LLRASYLSERPSLVIDRYPDGIAEKSFYQKNAPGKAIEKYARRRSGLALLREIEYLLVDDLDALLSVINLGAIPLHIWSSGSKPGPPGTGRSSTSIPKEPPSPA